MTRVSDHLIPNEIGDLSYTARRMVLFATPKVRVTERGKGESSERNVACGSRAERERERETEDHQQSERVTMNRETTIAAKEVGEEGAERERRGRTDASAAVTECRK